MYFITSLFTLLFVRNSADTPYLSQMIDRQRPLGLLSCSWDSFIQLKSETSSQPGAKILNRNFAFCIFLTLQNFIDLQRKG